MNTVKEGLTEDDEVKECGVCGEEAPACEFESIKVKVKKDVSEPSAQEIKEHYGACSI